MGTAPAVCGSYATTDANENRFRALFGRITKLAHAARVHWFDAAVHRSECCVLYMHLRPDARRPASRCCSGIRADAGAKHRYSIDWQGRIRRLACRCSAGSPQDHCQRSACPICHEIRRQCSTRSSKAALFRAAGTARISDRSVCWGSSRSAGSADCTEWRHIRCRI
jgi:hypothetical protein